MLEAFGSKTMTCHKVTLLVLCCCALHKGQGFGCALSKGQSMLMVVALHKGHAMVAEQGSLAASGGGDKPPGKDGDDPTRDKDNQGPWEDWEWEDWEEEQKKWRNQKKVWFWDEEKGGWDWKWMSGAMQQNIRRDALKKHFKVGPNCTDYERRMINLASMGNSRLARIERRERERREREEEEKEEAERRTKESYAQHMQQWHMHQSQAQQWQWWAWQQQQQQQQQQPWSGPGMLGGHFIKAFFPCLSFFSDPCRTSGHCLVLATPRCWPRTHDDLKVVFFLICMF